ncbi:phosphoribosylformylglycinamidine synthase subunit PurL [Candidatus Nitrosocosmicus agrestis]|jgi:phosphoribosylformylglycinamidine synthase|uniref:phosphoribosylformylglycinamidine synthase subunit PurL n=1 Tax=Candidatus Nitrosocosmicus agrestis TaxID=2563600 RepID=UPI00122E03C5|nr:phosphoribosylformylglycinamidine synthase subunit PurL [Candidatus Nitrosocosmicus sp. SS]KAA2279563.1 phosphoribosylformylglycinamidine synthase subunit PurL [Candidatus Nitrosocosmicus sp. SS]KAF0868155.1 phosphoribosylformylglycinamidine synthase subunit PurL [Candidatus Nitrosocosmicus sp. SS]
MGILSDNEYKYLKNNLGRTPNELELNIISAEWSEHCSYKSSKKHIKLLPTQSKSLIVGPGYDAGVIDVGDGEVVTIHIESHNHPSAVEPYGGAATGVGGVLRDILSMGTRPIALYNALRFGNIDSKTKDGGKNLWLFKNVVRGIADYGNCMGVPTLGGEVEFDESFNEYCLVDVASIGFSKKDKIIGNTASKGDLIILAGNATGIDGIHGASFASKNLEEENRSAVQIPDPFLEKILMEATMEAVDRACIKSMKDLGGGGLSCCLSETADNLNKGMMIDLSMVPTNLSDITDIQIMISESQERMLYIIDPNMKEKFFEIFNKHEITFAIIGEVTDDGELCITKKNNILARMPAKLIAHAPLLERETYYPSYLKEIKKSFKSPAIIDDYENSIYQLLSDPSICSKKWVYQQFDHEVGVRTVTKPGESDSSVVKLNSEKYLTFSLDGNSKQCYLDPYNGTLGILAESLRNISCSGSKPLGVVDHLQFGNPENKEVFWTFVQSITAIRDFCNFMEIPVVGGKVSLYNETSNGSIKPSPVIGMLGIINSKTKMRGGKFGPDEFIFIIGTTKEDLGGSEYFEYCLNLTGGQVPIVDLDILKQTIEVIKSLVNQDGLINAIHDCSKGGLVISLLEMAIQSQIGFNISTTKIPNECSRLDYLLFSESHNRFLLTTKNPLKLASYLDNMAIPFANIGITQSTKECIIKANDKENIILDLVKVTEIYNNCLNELFKGKS